MPRSNAAPASAPPPALVARQPILDRSGRRVAYELLYRGEAVPGAEAGTILTARVLVEALGNLGVEALADGGQLYVNFTTELLFDPDVLKLLPARSLVIEVLETIPATEAVLAALQRLKRAGCTIALDDYVPSPERAPLLAVADLVKVDVLASRGTLEAEVAFLKQYPVRLLAEKVEDRAMHERCLGLGFELFQGYYFFRPEAIEQKPLAANQAVLIEAMATISAPDIDVQKLAGIIGRDPVLSFQLLKLANSPMFRRRRELSTIHDTVVLLGCETIRQWASLLLMSRIAPGKPSEILRVALVRARMCEGVAASDKPLCYLAGLLSVMEGLLDRPMSQVIADLNLTGPVAEALSSPGQGAIGQVLGTVFDYEDGRLGELPAATAERLREAYLSALTAADALLAQLANGAVAAA